MPDANLNIFVLFSLWFQPILSSCLVCVLIAMLQAIPSLHDGIDPGSLIATSMIVHWFYTHITIKRMSFLLFNVLVNVVWWYLPVALPLQAHATLIQSW